jgi:hypothetical protein
MASILTPEDVVRRIAAECTFVDERGAVGIRLKPAAAIVRQYGSQFRSPRRKQAASPTETVPAAVSGKWRRRRLGNLRLSVEEWPARRLTRSKTAPDEEAGYESYETAPRGINAKQRVAGSRAAQPGDLAENDGGCVEFRYVRP